jgi:ribosomal RNA assembly protein
MIRRELCEIQKANLATESWDRFLPKCRKHHLNAIEKKKIKLNCSYGGNMQGCRI